MPDLRLIHRDGGDEAADVDGCGSVGALGVRVEQAVVEGDDEVRDARHVEAGPDLFEIDISFCISAVTAETRSWAT